MNGSNIPSARSQTSSTDERQAAVARFGPGYDAFLLRYPTIQRRNDTIHSVHDAVYRGGHSLAEIDRIFKPGASEWWLRFMLVEMMSFLGAMETVSAYQVRGLAARIRQEFYFLTPDELTYFFYAFPLGSYGKLYASRTVNPQDILMAVTRYAHDVFEQRAARYSERIEREGRARLADPSNVTWEQFCRQTGRNPKDNPLARIHIIRRKDK